MNIAKEEIFEVLKKVYDPEIPVDIVNLGLVYEVGVDAGKVSVRMTTTAPGCPMGRMIAANVEKAILGLEGIHEVQVELVYDPPWNTQMVSEEGRRILGL